MGWHPVQDISITLNGHDIEALRSGLVDAIIGREVTYAVAKNEGYPVLMDTSEWELAIAGNSIQVEAGWLDEATNREAARRFLQATVEGIALFHQDRELAFDVMSRWHGITDRDTAAIIYEQGRSMSRKPYPCYEGIANTFGQFDSNEMRKYSAEDFYDDSLVRELDEEGFIDSFYE